MKIEMTQEVAERVEKLKESKERWHRKVHETDEARAAVDSDRFLLGEVVTPQLGVKVGTFLRLRIASGDKTRTYYYQVESIEGDTRRTAWPEGVKGEVVAYINTIRVNKFGKSLNRGRAYISNFNLNEYEVAYLTEGEPHLSDQNRPNLIDNSPGS